MVCISTMPTIKASTSKKPREFLSALPGVAEDAQQRRRALPFPRNRVGRAGPREPPHTTPPPTFMLSATDFFWCLTGFYFFSGLIGPKIFDPHYLTLVMTSQNITPIFDNLLTRFMFS